MKIMNWFKKKEKQTTWHCIVCSAENKIGQNEGIINAIPDRSVCIDCSNKAGVEIWGADWEYRKPMRELK